MKTIILAGGRATRLPESAKDIPKVLVDVGGKPMLQHQIEQLQKHGFFDIRLALGYRAEQVITWLESYKSQSENHGLKIDFVIEPEPLDTGGAIKFAAQELEEPFLVFNGDIVSDINVRKFSDRFSRYARSGEAREKNPTENLIAITYMPDARSYGIIKKRGGRVVEFLEKPSVPVPGHINAGFYILSPQIFESAKEKKFSIEKDIFPQLASQGKLRYYIHRGFWTDAGTEERLREVRRILKRE